jgi:hypothetical protein
MRSIPAVVALASVLLSGAALAASPGTKIVHFQAFDLSGRTAGIHIDRSASGSCFSGSIAMPRPDAWRCMIGNQILDPCLQAPEGAAPLVCIAGTKAIRLRLTKPLPLSQRNKVPKRFFAWRLVLQSGDVCDVFTGTAAGTIQGHDLVYGCRSGGTTTLPVRGRPFWSVWYLRKGADPADSTKLSQLPIRKVARAIG